MELILPDYTIFYQIAGFLVLVFILNIILYRPIRRILVQRSDEADMLQKKIEGYDSRSEHNENKIEEGMIQTKKEGYLEKEHLKGQALEEERGILQEAGTSAEEKITMAKKEIQINISDVHRTLENQVAAFSKELSEKILGRSIK